MLWKCTLCGLGLKYIALQPSSLICRIIKCVTVCCGFFSFHSKEKHLEWTRIVNVCSLLWGSAPSEGREKIREGREGTRHSQKLSALFLFPLTSCFNYLWLWGTLLAILRKHRAPQTSPRSPMHFIFCSVRRSPCQQHLCLPAIHIDKLLILPFRRNLIFSVSVGEETRQVR